MAAGQGGGVVLGYLKYVMGLDSLAFQEGLGDADKRLKAAQKSLKKTSDKFADMGAKLSLALTAPLVGFAAKGINEARETAAAMAQVNAAITSMGNAAGISSDQLVKMADKLELSSLYEGDQILQKVTANLLTFGNVAGENFARAQQAAVDLSTRMGTDLQASTLLIGKALNDPVKGMNALARAGIQLTASQKEQIKAFTETGQAAKAQAIILGELERQFGGAAAAAQNVDPFNKLNDAFNQMAEKVGTSLLPLLPPLGEALISILDAFGSLSPETQKWVLIVGGAAAVLGPFAIAISAVASGFGVMLPLLAKIVPLFYATGVAGTAGATGLTALGVAVATIGGPLIAGAAAIAVLLKYKEPIDKFGLEVVASIKKMVLGVTNWLGGALKAAFNLVMAPIEAARKAFFNLYDAVVGHSYIPDMVDEIGQNMGRLDQLMVDPAQKATKTTGDKFRDMAAKIKTVIDELYPKTAELRAEMEKLAALQADQSLSPQVRTDAISRQSARVSDAQVAAADEVSPALKVSAEAAARLDAAWQTVKDSAAEATTSLQTSADAAGQAFVDMANKSLNALSNLASAIKGGGILDILSSAFNAFGSIAGAGLFGKSLKSSFASFQPISGFRANGGPVSGGKSYVVGERGPELFTASRSGYVHPNGANDNGGGSRVQIIPSPYFNVVVDGRVQSGVSAAAPSIVTGSSQGTQKAMARSNSRRLA